MREQGVMKMKSREQMSPQEETLQLLWNQQGWRIWRSKHSHLQETRQKNEKVVLSSQNALGLQPAADQGCPGWTELSPTPPPPHLQLKKRGSHVVTGGFCSRSEELRCPDVA